jgi:hypothetical protein
MPKADCQALAYVGRLEMICTILLSEAACPGLSRQPYSSARVYSSIVSEPRLASYMTYIDKHNSRHVQLELQLRELTSARNTLQKLKSCLIIRQSGEEKVVGLAVKQVDVRGGSR